MVRVRIRLPGFCTGRASACARIRSQPQQYKQSYNTVYKDDDMAGSSNNSIEMNFKTDMMIKKNHGSKSKGGNRIMVVVDFSPAAKNTLEWALSHTVQTQEDTVYLLLVTKQGANYGHKPYELLGSMKEMCEMRRPEVHVEALMVEGKEKGPKIVAEAKKQKVSLLVLGQRKRTLLRKLRSMCTHRKTRIVEYCIQYANCMTIAVRRKSRKYGGYLITTKRHKNFWLLA